MLLQANWGNAQNLIAVQNVHGPVFYTKLSDAISNSVDGDTIYIPGGGHTISNPISKRLHLIGAGYFADSTVVAGITILNSLTLFKGIDGGSIEGLYINSTLQIGTSNEGKINGFDIRRCYIVGGIIFNNTANMPSNISITESILGQIQGSSENISVSNCLLLGPVTNASQSVIQNNIFFQAYQYNSVLAFSGSNCMVKNNVFFTNHYMSGTNNTFYNNIGIWNNGVYTGSYATNAFGSSNVTESWESTFGNSSSTKPFDYPNNDFHLKPTSKGKNAGTDGTDIGIYGGAYPWKEGSVPANPHFQSVKISPKTDNSGILNVRIKVAAQDN